MSMSEGVAGQVVPAEVAEPRFAQSQTPRRSTDECSGQSAQIGFMADQEATSVNRSHQRPWITPGRESGLDLDSGSQAGLNRQLGSLDCTPVGTAEQQIGLIPQLAEAVSHRESALHPELRQWAIRMVLAMVPFSRDAMTEQEKINRNEVGHADAGCSTLHFGPTSDLALPPE